MTTDEVSRYCMRCTPKHHAKYGPSVHETNEHDEWLVRMKEKHGD